MAEILPKGRIQETSPAEKLEALVYNTNNEIIRVAINVINDVVRQGNLSAAKLEVPDHTALLAIDINDDTKWNDGDRVTVVKDTPSPGSGLDYVTYAIAEQIDATDPSKTNRVWVVDSVGVPIASDTNDGLLSKDKYTKLDKLPTDADLAIAFGDVETDIEDVKATADSNETRVGTLETTIGGLGTNKLDKTGTADTRFNSDDNGVRIIENRDDIIQNAENILATETAADVLNAQVVKNTEDIIVSNKGISDNAGEISKSNTAIKGLGTDKQNIKLAYKQAEGKSVTVEEQIEINEKENIDSKLREDNFLKKDDGEMAAGYNASGNKEVIVKETFDDQKAAVQKQLNDLNTALAAKADVTDLGQKPLIYIPGQGADENTAVTPIIPVINGGQLEYTFDATDWAAWKSRVDTDNKIVNGIKGEIIIKDNDATTYPGEESYNNGSDTKIPFGTDTDARWSLNDGNLVIITNNQNRDITRTLRQLTLFIESSAGTSIDQGARGLIAKLQGEAQKIAIDLIGITSKTVEGALIELKNRIDAVEDSIKGISYDEPSKTTNISDNLIVGETLDAKKLTQGGVQVALKTDILDIIQVDENSNTVEEVRNAIKASLNSTAGRKSVIFNHADSVQKDETYIGYIEQITADPIEGGVAYFGESSFDKFTTTDDGRPFVFQLLLNIKGWQTWQATLDTTDPRYKSDYATTTQDTLNGYTVLYARRETPLNVNNENVLTDSVEQASFDAMETLLKGAL